MRYTIGVKVLESNGKACEGIYGLNSKGMPVILASFPHTLDVNSKIFVIDDLSDAQKFVKHLSKSYYKEFHDKAADFNLDISQFRFYLLKVDSSKMKGLKLKSSIAPTKLTAICPTLKYFYFEEA